MIWPSSSFHFWQIGLAGLGSVLLHGLAGLALLGLNPPQPKLPTYPPSYFATDPVFQAVLLPNLTPEEQPRPKPNQSAPASPVSQHSAHTKTRTISKAQHPSPMPQVTKPLLANVSKSTTPRTTPKASTLPSTTQATLLTTQKPTRTSEKPDWVQDIPSHTSEQQQGKQPEMPQVLQPPVVDPRYHLKNPKPKYPSLARRMGQEGTVALAVTVSPNGTARLVEVQNSSGHTTLDKAAMRAISRWRFLPATMNGEPVERILVTQWTYRLSQ